MPAIGNKIHGTNGAGQQTRTGIASGITHLLPAVRLVEMIHVVVQFDQGTNHTEVGCAAGQVSVDAIEVELD